MAKKLSPTKLKRIAKYGEVFTPMAAAEDMCDLLDPDIWSDEDTMLFEPTCGDGNIVVVLLRRRLLSLYAKAKHAGHEDPKGYAVAIALSGLVAVDILEDNVQKTRDRVLSVVGNWIQRNANPNDVWDGTPTGKWAFVEMMVNRNIHMNEMLSCLQDDPVKAEQEAKKTKAGYEWFQKHGHKPIKSLLKGEIIDILSKEEI